MSLYLRDRHTPEALLRIRQRPGVWLTPFHEAELAHAVAQQVFRGQISLDEANRTTGKIAANRDVWIILPFPESAFEGAAELARAHVARLGTRTLDSLHVAAALELKAERFWTFDERQAKLAKAAGLRVT
jgi:predicted nucleic acid-binding protein